MTSKEWCSGLLKLDSLFVKSQISNAVILRMLVPTRVTTFGAILSLNCVGLKSTHRGSLEDPSHSRMILPFRREDRWIFSG